jgi:hypothetical protein
VLFDLCLGAWGERAYRIIYLSQSENSRQKILPFTSEDHTQLPPKSW